MNTYKPGQSIRLSVTITQLGVLTNVSPLYVEVVASDGTEQSTPTIVNDSAGAYHADFAIPLTARGSDSPWWYRFWTTNATPSLNGLGENPFLVKPLAF
jgi:uncharacterized protein YfaS (alpha-2-macroglobulin family)